VTSDELKELQNIRELLVLLLYKVGAKQSELARALGLTDRSSISKMLPKRGVKTAEVKCLTNKK
jgi:transcriptional regulator